MRSRKEKAQVATISAHGDGKMGELVADAFERVGDEGVISVEEAKTTETTLEVVEGTVARRCSKTWGGRTCAPRPRSDRTYGTRARRPLPLSPGAPGRSLR